MHPGPMRACQNMQRSNPQGSQWTERKPLKKSRTHKTQSTEYWGLHDAQPAFADPPPPLYDRSLDSGALGNHLRNAVLWIRVGSESHSRLQHHSLSGLPCQHFTRSHSVDIPSCCAIHDRHMSRSCFQSRFGCWRSSPKACGAQGSMDIR